MMFSLRPIRLSPRPSMAASVSTRVVSWKRRRGQPRLGGQRRLGDAHDLGATLGGALALLDHAPVGVTEHLGVDPLAGQEPGVARLLHADAAGHLAHDQLDVLVVDRHALLAVHLLDLLRRGTFWVSRMPLISISSFGSNGPSVIWSPAVTSWPSGTIGRAPSGQDRPRAPRRRRRSTVTRDALALVLTDAHDTGRLGQPGGTTRGAGLEQLDDAGQTAGDVLAGDTTGVERPHRQLGTGLTDRLGGDDADGLTELDRPCRWPANGRSRWRTRRARRRTPAPSAPAAG